MAAPALTIRELERTLCASGLSRVQAKRAIHYIRSAGFLDAITTPHEKQRGIFGTIKAALGRK